MKKNTISMGSLLALSFVCSSYLQADVSDAQMRSLENRVNALEQKKNGSNLLNPSGRPQVRDGADLFFTADWLIWQAHENGLGYAVKAEAGQPVETALYNSSVKNMEFDYDFGFRLGLGWNTPHDGWDMGATWTWFQNHAKKNKSVGAAYVLFSPTNYEPAEADFDGYRSSAANWGLHLNLIDLDLGREFFISKWMTLRPFIGLRSGWIRQNKQETFIDPIVAVGTAQTGTFAQGKNNYWGLGPRFGLNTQWGLGHGVSIFGNAGASILSGFFHVDTTQQQLFTGSYNDAITNSDGYRVGRVISEIALGVRYDAMLADDHLHFGIQAGWEQLMFFGQNQFKQFVGTTPTNAGAYVANQGDLTIQGWTISVRLDF